MKRLFDLAVALTATFLLAIPILIVSICILLTSTGPIIYWSNRVGQFNLLFDMPKFRSMLVDTPAVATHLLSNPDTYLSPIGSFLRKSSLDELPQLWSVLRGDMSIVGPRPALFNQEDLITLRTEHGIDKLKPGITGWAQVNGRDAVSIPEKVALDTYYLNHQCFKLDCYIIFLTLLKVIKRDHVYH